MTMDTMSIQQFNANTSAAFAKVEAGETIKITKNGKVIAMVTPERVNRMDDPKFRAARERMLERMQKGFSGLKGAVSYDERVQR
jgi:antitoxin (DNA-binding transcriptional repressor) of toxin-antitoxin stability system